MNNDLPCFDTLKTLAEESPEELERLRRDLADELIASAPVQSQRRLRGLQFQIDMKRRLAKSEMGACLQLSEMMMDSFDRLRLALNGQPLPEQLLRDETVETAIIPFRKRRA